MFEVSSLSEACRPGISELSLFRIGSSGSSMRSSHRGLLYLFRFSFGVHAAAGVVGFGFRSVRSKIREHLVVGALRAGGSIEFCQRGIVSKECLQARRLRGEQLYLRVQHVQLRTRACVQARLGQTQRFFGLLNIFFLALDQLAVLMQT